ncbi:unnamed protein product [Polarella glacialis]|uniref:Uncharacterized protein n=1 Tax=Polarella glacialis TaxID=89957 RepID=A0A813IKT1_POLGL|nr:unnamed protein product [Polarella glacialis]
MNAFATGSNQNSGNFISDRPSTGIHAPPGGVSTICFGDYDAKTDSEKPSSMNAFATGSNQNSGGGVSTICLGDYSADEAEKPRSLSAHAPGGASTVCLGMDESDWKSSASSIRQEAVLLGVQASPRQPAGGATTIMLGASPSEQAAKAEDVRMEEPDVVEEAADSSHPAEVMEVEQMVVEAAKEEELEDIRMSSPEPVVKVGEDDTAAAAGAAKRFLQFGEAGVADPSERAPPGGAASIDMGSSWTSSEWKASSSDFVSQSDAIRDAPASARHAPGGMSTIMLGASQSEVAQKQAWLAKDEDVKMESPSKKTKVDEVAAAGSVMASSKQRLIFDQDPPTPLRNSTPRAPPGGASSVMLG